MPLISFHDHWTIEEKGIKSYEFSDADVIHKTTHLGIEIMFTKQNTIVTRVKNPSGDPNTLSRQFHFGGEAFRYEAFLGTDFNPEDLKFIGELQRRGTSPILEFQTSNLMDDWHFPDGNHKATQSGDGKTLEMWTRDLAAPLTAIKFTLRSAPPEIRKAFANIPDLPN